MFVETRQIREEAQRLNDEIYAPTLYEGPPLGMERSSVPSMNILPDRDSFIRLVNAGIERTLQTLDNKGIDLSVEKTEQLTRFKEKLEVLRGLAAGQRTMPFYR